jgi:hypothetical protein
MAVVQAAAAADGVGRSCTGAAVVVTAAAAALVLLQLCTCVVAAAGAGGDGAKYKDPTQPLNARIDDLLARMTLAEKIGQMSQIEREKATPDVISSYFIGRTMIFRPEIVQSYALALFCFNLN